MDITGRTVVAALLVLAVCVTSSANAEEPQADTTRALTETHEKAIDIAAGATTEAAQAALESLTEETEIELDISLLDHHIVTVAAR